MDELYLMAEVDLRDFVFIKCFDFTVHWELSKINLFLRYGPDKQRRQRVSV